MNFNGFRGLECFDPSGNAFIDMQYVLGAEDVSKLQYGAFQVALIHEPFRQRDKETIQIVGNVNYHLVFGVEDALQISGKPDFKAFQGFLTSQQAINYPLEVLVHG